VERWRKPVAPVAIQQDTRRDFHDGNVWRQHIDVTISPDDLARMKLGYVCLRCWEPHERPFPENCTLCGYSMAAYQARDIEHEFEGEVHVGPSTSYGEEIERLREERERRIWTPGSSIYLN